jgi:hypothetical protein
MVFGFFDFNFLRRKWTSEEAVAPMAIADNEG